MRPQQQNRRMRGRNGGGNNNRRGPNPLNRNYESNGPDVKIRGSAQQIAEKYTALARDAMSSGDRVMAENYLQHAEHYNRIIAAAQAQVAIQHAHASRDDFDDEDEDREELETVASAREAQASAGIQGEGPQPTIEGMPAEVARNGGAVGRENDIREEGGSEARGGNRHQRDRRNAQRGDQNFRREEGQAQEDAVASAGQEEQSQSESFNPADIAAQASQNGAGQTEEETRRGRRPRRPRTARPQEAGADAAAPATDEAGEPVSVES